MEKIKFATNVAIETALKFPDGKLCDSQFGGAQYMFTTTDDRMFFVAEKVAQKIHGLRLKVGEPFTIGKMEKAYDNGRKGIEWLVEKVGFAPGEQPDGTFAVQPGASVGAPAPASASANTSAHTNGNGNGTKALAVNGNGAGKSPAAVSAAEQPSQIHLGWAQFLLSQTNALIDVYAAASGYASQRYGNQVKAEDVRALLTTAFINVSRNGGVNVA